MVRGTRRLASGLAFGLVLLTLYMVFYGPGAGSKGSDYHLPSWRSDNPSLPKPVVTPSSTPGDKSPLPPSQPGKEFPGGPDKPPAAPEKPPTLPEKPPAAHPDKPSTGGQDKSPAQNPKVVNPESQAQWPENVGVDVLKPTKAATTSDAAPSATPSPKFPKPIPVLTGPTKFIAETHRELYAKYTPDGKYWLVDFSPYRAYNPNFIPHPTKNDTWITVAQTHKTAEDNPVWFTQLVCEAKFEKGKLNCQHPPLVVPIPPSWSTKCEGELAHFNYNIGPHDARAFYGPKVPYILYGTQSKFNCFGQFFQDLTLVTDWPWAQVGNFSTPTDIQRPPPHHYERVEKNWFLWWDMNGEIYVHHDIHPKRVFGPMDTKGGVDKDLALVTAEKDAVCMAKRMPTVKPTIDESIHQATNSLAVTLCKRADPTCQVTETNTFVFTIFHWKSFYEFHGLYEPYVFMFRQAPPFDVYAISSKPLWFRGRRLPGEWRGEGGNGWNQTEMVYTTSIAWKEHGQKYHGYIDDTLFLGFGVEDKETGGMDLPAADILQDIKLCDDTLTPPTLAL